MRSNEQIARELLEQARALARQGGNLFRVRAYRQAAMTVQGLRHEAADILDTEGRRGLEDLPGIGRHLARSIAEYVRTGVWNHYSDRPARLAV